MTTPSPQPCRLDTRLLLVPQVSLLLMLVLKVNKPWTICDWVRNYAVLPFYWGFSYFCKPNEITSTENLFPSYQVNQTYPSVTAFFPGGSHGNPLQYSCLEHPMDRGAWWTTVHRVAQSWTQLKQLSMHVRTGFLYCSCQQTSQTCPLTLISPHQYLYSKNFRQDHICSSEQSLSYSFDTEFR